MLCVLTVCVPLCWRHFQVSLTGLLLWLAEVLRGMESAVMICIDFKGNRAALLWG